MSLDPEKNLSKNKFTSTDFIKDFSNSMDQVHTVYLENDTRVETGIGFEDPYDSLWLKMITVGVYMVEIFSSAVMIAFISFERDYGHYRTLINQLLSYLYGAVIVLVLFILLTSSKIKFTNSESSIFTTKFLL